MKPLGCRLDRLFMNVSSHSAEADNRLIMTHTGNRLARTDERNQGMDEGASGLIMFGSIFSVRDA